MTKARRPRGAVNTDDPDNAETPEETPEETSEDGACGTDVEPMPAGMRRCLLTRAVMPRDRLIRFVVDPDGQVVPDVDRRLPGRGLWLSPGRDMIEMASRKRAFARSARRAVTVPPDLADRVESALSRRCLDLLGLARRAGQVVSGFESVRARLREAAGEASAERLPARGRAGRGREVRPAPPAVLFAARDGGADSRAKVAGLAAAVVGADAAQTAPVLVVGFDATELGRPLGRDRAVHVALDRGRLARSVLEGCEHLVGFRSGPMMLSLSEAVAAARRDSAVPED